MSYTWSNDVNPQLVTLQTKTNSLKSWKRLINEMTSLLGFFAKWSDCCNCESQKPAEVAAITWKYLTRKFELFMVKE